MITSARASIVAATLAVPLLLATPPASGAETRASLPDIEDEVMCPICGTTLELSSSPQAERERELIRRLIVEGWDKDEIKDALVAEYGSEVLADPDQGGFEITAWLVPLIALSATVGALLFALLRSRPRSAQDAARKISSHDSKALDVDMSEYDL